MPTVPTMNELLDATPSTLTAFRQWVHDATAELWLHRDNESREYHRKVARLIRRAKQHAYTLDLEVANDLPERPTKTPLDGLLRLRDCLRLPTPDAQLLTI